MGAIVKRGCKFKGCSHPVVGHSTTGKGWVCKGHNEQEWGEALRNHNPLVSRRLLADSKRHLVEGVLL